MILFFRLFQLGDVVTVAGETGAVEDIGLFATTLHTPDARKIILQRIDHVGNIESFALGLRVGSIAWESPTAKISTSRSASSEAVASRRRRLRPVTSLRSSPTWLHPH